MSEEDLITAEEHKISDLSFWKDLVRDLRRDYKEFKLTSKDLETQLEQMLMDANDDADRANADLNSKIEEFTTLKRAHEKIQYDFKKLKDKYNSEVKDVEQEADKIKQEYSDLKAKNKGLNDEKITLEVENEELERKNQGLQGAVEDLEEKIDSLLEEIALTQSEKDDTIDVLKNQNEKLNTQIEEMEIDLEYKEKRIKKYKFLQILHDYPTSASEILDKAAKEVKVPERSSHILPSSTRNNTGGEFSLFAAHKPSRKSDAFFMPQKTSFYQFATEEKEDKSGYSSDDEKEGGKIDLFGDEIGRDMRRVPKKNNRKQSIDVCGHTPEKKSDLYHEEKSEEDKLNKSVRHSSYDLMATRNDKRMSEMMEKFERLNDSKNLTPKKEETVNRETMMNIGKPDTPELPKPEGEEKKESPRKVPMLDLNSKPMNSLLTGDSTMNQGGDENEDQPTVRKIERVNKTPDMENRFMSFGGLLNKPETNKSQVKKTLTDIEALLEYDGDDMDGLAMANSKDALRVLDNIEEMIDSRINMICENDYNIDGYGDNNISLTVV